MNPLSPRTILVRAPNWVGDQILAFPFFYHLRRAYPEAKIVSVCVPWVKSLQFKSQIDDVVVLPQKSGSTWREKWRVVESAARALRERGPWDLGISLPNSISAAWLLRRSGVEIRRGYAVEGRSLLLNDRVRWDPDSSRHRSQAYVDLLPEAAAPTRPAVEFWGKEAESEFEDPSPGELKAFLGQEEWPGIEPLTPPATPYWVLAPGATAESRRWPLEYFQNLARMIHARTGWKGLVVGGVQEISTAEALIEDASCGLEDWTARGEVAILWRLFQQAKLTVCNESGLAHVAALCGSPVQIICGAADPKRTRPIGPGKVRVAVNPVECWPCEKNTCWQPSEKKIQCLRGIHPDAVEESLRQIGLS